MQKNGFTKELMHKQITETIITSSPSGVKRLEQTERLRSESAKGNKSALRTWANRAWYDKHKAWKKAYNAKYYQDNKDYWQNYYKFAHDKAKARKRMAAETEQEAKAAKNKFGENSKEYKRARDRAITNAEWALEDKAELKIAKMNLERAIADQKWYSENTKRLKVTDAWLDGSKQIRDVVDIGATLDERIADGFYFARSLKLVKYIFSHPELLDKPLNEPSNFDYNTKL